jgi:hypothetical protein
MVETIDFINQVIDQDFSKAAPSFNDIITSKMSDALEAERINVAGQIFNGVEDREAEDQYELDLDNPNEDDDDVDDEDDDFEDEELEDAAEEALNDEED